MTLLREADPARDARPDPAEAEALLRRVLAEPAAPSRRGRRLVWRLAPVAVLVLALVAVALAAWPRASTVDRAYAAVTPSQGTIVHVVSLFGIREPDGGLTRRVRREIWTTADGRTHRIDDYLYRDSYSETEVTPEATRLYTSDAGGLLYDTPQSGSTPSAPPPLLTAVGKTAIDRFQNAYRAGALEEQGTLTERGRTLQRYTTTSGRRVDYLIDPTTDELVAERQFTAEGRSLETRVQLIERLPLNRRTEDLLTMPDYTDARVIRFGR